MASKDTSIVGVWRLASTRAIDPGGRQVAVPYGPRGMGLVTLTSDGRMMAVLVDGRASLPEGTSRQWAAVVTAPPRTERLKSLEIPTLVLHGSADTLIRPEAGRHTAQCIPGAEYHEIEGWGHDMPLEAIPVVQGYVLPFIARVEAERKGRA